MVGSKGKGTAAAAASQFLNACGFRVVAVTSPHYVEVRERFRVDGVVVDEGLYGVLSGELADVLDAVPWLLRSPVGYLSPWARFLAVGCLLGVRVGADVLVVEAGVGGWSDELSCLPLRVLACTAVFGEHRGVLGSRVGDIAANTLFPGFGCSVGAVVVGDLPEVCEPVVGGLVAAGKRVVGCAGVGGLVVVTGFVCGVVGECGDSVGYGSCVS